MNKIGESTCPHEGYIPTREADHKQGHTQCQKVVSAIREKKNRVKEIGVGGCSLVPRDSLAEGTFDAKNDI